MQLFSCVENMHLALTPIPKLTRNPFILILHTGIYQVHKAYIFNFLFVELFIRLKIYTLSGIIYARFNASLKDA